MKANKNISLFFLCMFYFSIACYGDLSDILVITFEENHFIIHMQRSVLVSGTLDLYIFPP